MHVYLTSISSLRAKSEKQIIEGTNNKKGGGGERPASLILQALLPNQGVQDISGNKMNCYLMKIDSENKN